MPKIKSNIDTNMRGEDISLSYGKINEKIRNSGERIIVNKNVGHILYYSKL